MQECPHSVMVCALIVLHLDLHACFIDAAADVSSTVTSRFVQHDLLWEACIWGTVWPASSYLNAADWRSRPSSAGMLPLHKG